MTAVDIKTKETYCNVWHKGVSGNDIASAIIVIIADVTKQRPEINRIILWSDACVPQNRNSHMSSAILEFLHSTGNNITRIEQKFREPGHSSVQEVDAVHSVIDRDMKKTELHSPLVILRALINVKSNKKYSVKQLLKDDFKTSKLFPSTVILMGFLTVN
jgi:hypothetical protein